MNALETITIEPPCGPVTGRRKDGTYLFAGIPYAEAPVGNLRFRPPVAKARFTSPYSALKFSPAAPQVPSGGMTDSAPVRWSEDCLALNVSTPACDDAGRAVLVWIHGGGYRTGQSSIPWYAGTGFNKNGDIVVVSINYRLGALGFADLSHLGDEFADSAVNGLRDQILALEWVRDNIATFGGDPERVTIAGESAGGFSVSTLLGCEAAQGLFQQAIPQSGAAHHTLPKAAAETVTAKFLETLGQDDLIGLEAASVEDILEAQVATSAYFEGGMRNVERLGTTVSAFYPAHGTPLLPKSPYETIREGLGSTVKVLTGSNTHETTLWGYGTVDEDKLTSIAASLGADDLIPAYRKAHPNADSEEILVALTSDHMFRIPAIRLAEARSEHTSNTWLYLFNWESRAFGGRLRATHALEIPFAFDNLNRPGVDAFIGPGDKPQHVADVMHRAWIDFINEGDPGWAPYGDDRMTMVFDDTSATEEDPMGETRAAWTGVR